MRSWTVTFEEVLSIARTPVTSIYLRRNAIPEAHCRARPARQKDWLGGKRMGNAAPT